MEVSWWTRQSCTILPFVGVYYAISAVSHWLHPLLIMWAAQQTPGAQMMSDRRWRGTWPPVPLPAAAEQCWPELSCKWGNLMVAINIANRGAVQQCWGLPPWSVCQNASPQAVGADAVAVCPLGASWCWRFLQRGRWTILRADLHVSHSYHYFRIIISFLASPSSLKISVATEDNKQKFMHPKQLMPIKRSHSVKGIAEERMHPFEAFGNSQTPDWFA